MFRFINGPSLLALVVLSILITIAFHHSTPEESGLYTFEVEVKSTERGNVQLYYDIGRGLNETDSQREVVLANQSTLLHFPLPFGIYRSLRFDPLDHETHIQISHARIVNQSGATFAEFAPSSFHPVQQIAVANVQGDVLDLVTSEHGEDPNLTISIGKPFVLAPRQNFGPVLVSTAKILGGLLLALVAAGAFLNRFPWTPQTPVNLRDWIAHRPNRAVALLSFLAVVVSSYPVIFAGKSFVSPNCGVALLYDAKPPIPGVQDNHISQSRGSDIAAMMWSFLPLSSLQHRAIFQDGELPLWDRYNSAGSPALGQGISCFGDPLHWLPIIADGNAWGWDLNFLISKWLFSVGIGLLVWRLTRHVPATLILTVSSQFIGFYVYRINHPAIFSLGYAPWILYCWVRIAQGTRLRDTVWWALGFIIVNGSEINTGTVKEAYMLILFLNVTGAFLLFVAEKPWKEKVRDLAVVAWASVLLIAMSSPVWLTFFDTLGRSFTTYDEPRAYQLQPGMLVGLFDEIFYRPFEYEENLVDPSVNFCILVGFLWILIRWRAFLTNKVVAVLTLSTVLPLALVFGAMPREIVEKIPFIKNILHVDNTFSCVLIILLCVIAGFGWKDAWERLGSSEGKKEAVGVVVLMMGMLALFLGTELTVIRGGFINLSWGLNTKISPFIANYGWSLLLGVIVGLFTLALIRTRQRATAATTIVLVTVIAVLHWRHGLETGDNFDNYHILPGVRADLHAASPAIETLSTTRPKPFRTVGYDDHFLPGWSGMYDIEGISGPDPLWNKYYRQILECCEIDRVWDWRYKVYDSTLDKLHKAYDFLNIRYFLGYPGANSKSAALLKKVTSADMDVYESPTAWPRAFFTDRLASYGHPLDLARMVREGDGTPFAAIHQVEADRIQLGNHISSDLGHRHVAAATDYRFTNNTTSFTVQASGPGVIVLTEAYLKDDFQAKLNGHSVDYFRANHAFKGIFVDAPGTYQVTFSYWPRHFTICLIAAAVGFVFLIISLVFALRFSSRENLSTTP